MADVDDDLDNEEGEEAEGKPIDELDAKTRKQLITSVVLLLANFVIFIGGVAGLGFLYNETVARESEMPFNRVDELLERIEAGQSIVSEQYSPYLSKMDDKTIFGINESYNILYNVSQTSEKDYGDAILIYRDAIFSVASNVRGSGVWYEFYSQDVIKLAKRSVQRLKQLEEYGAIEVN